jgi:ABC-type glycerol-3-phosphate transport system permease component
MSVQAASLPVAAPAQKPRRRFRPSRLVVNVVLAAIAIFWLVPSVGILIISLRPNSTFEQSGWWTVFTAPAPLTFSNPVASLYKVFDNATGLQLFGSVIGTIIFHVAFGLPFGIFLMRNFYSGIPHDLLEAGRIDGAGEWTLFRKVVMPIGIPALASLAIFQFIWVWNDLLVALIFLSGNPHYTLTLFLYSYVRSLSSNYWVISTGAIISIVIPLIVFFAFQRYFVRGVLAGAVK